MPLFFFSFCLNIKATYTSKYDNVQSRIIKKKTQSTLFTSMMKGDWRASTYSHTRGAWKLTTNCQTLMQSIYIICTQNECMLFVSQQLGIVKEFVLAYLVFKYYSKYIVNDLCEPSRMKDQRKINVFDDSLFIVFCFHQIPTVNPLKQLITSFDLIRNIHNDLESVSKLIQQTKIF